MYYGGGTTIELGGAGRAASPAKRWAARIGLGLALAVVLCVTAPIAQRAYHAPHYVAVTGRLTSLSPTDGVRYEYAVDGARYEGRRARLFGRSHGRGVALWEGPGAAYRFASAHWSSGDEIPVYYLPSDPERSALDIDLPWTGRWLLMLAPVLVGAVIVWAGVRIGRG